MSGLFALACIGVLSVAPSAGVNARPPAPTAPASAELFDYLVQDVCTDTNDKPVSGDPASCSRHRDIAIGEASPYVMTDFDKKSGATYAAMTSMPVKAPGGATEVLISKSLQASFNPDFRFSFDAKRDGYDIIDIAHSDFASFVRTSDGGCQDQAFARGPAGSGIAGRAGGWVIFPKTAPSTWRATSSMAVTTYHIQLTPGIRGCADGHSAGQTFWNRPARYRFETGKTLLAIRSDHFASAALASAQNALERSYFTRQYGFTRWEAWMPLSRCLQENGADSPRCHPERPDYALAGRCSVLNATATPYPGLDMWGGQKWVRVDCRDQTNYIALKTPQRMLDETMARTHGLVDIAPID